MLSCVGIITSLHPTCQKFPASFLAVIDQNNIGDPGEFIVDDPEFTFFRDVLGFSDSNIYQVTENAIRFFKDTFDLDFSATNPNNQNEYFLAGARMSPFKLADHINYLVTLNNWIETGNTHSKCYRILDGGFRVTFSTTQNVRGKYGGPDGKLATPTDFLLYGFYHIDICRRSPVIIQFQSDSPLRPEPIDNTYVINLNLHSRELGQGKAYGVFSVKPDPEEPGENHMMGRNAFTFH